MSNQTLTLSRITMGFFHNPSHFRLFCRINSKTRKSMWFKWGFKYFSLSKQLEYLREHGVMLGSRMRNDRKVFLYMVNILFVEGIKQNDRKKKEAEHLDIFNN